MLALALAAACSAPTGADAPSRGVPDAPEVAALPSLDKDKTPSPPRCSTMEDAHRHLRITAGEWQAFLDDLRRTLGRFDVPARERRELVAIVESTRAAIVDVAAAAGAAVS